MPALGADLPASLDDFTPPPIKPKAAPKPALDPNAVPPPPSEDFLSKWQTQIDDRQKKIDEGYTKLQDVYASTNMPEAGPMPVDAATPPPPKPGFTPELQQAASNFGLLSMAMFVVGGRGAAADDRLEQHHQQRRLAHRLSPHPFDTPVQ